MSVVNRMLQDIDRRRAAATGDAASPHTDVRGVVRRDAQSKSMHVNTLLLGAVLVVAVVVAAFMWNRAPDVTGAPSVSATPTSALPIAAPTRPAAPAAPSPSAAPIETAVPTTVAAAPRVSLQPAERLKLSMQLSALVADVPQERAKRGSEGVGSTTTAAAPAPSPAAPVAAAAAAPALSPAPVLAPGKTTITTIPVRQVASDETITSARQLWSDGARASALTTLRDALAAAEAARNQRATAPLARELARLEVADNRPQVALDLLKRLENLLAEDGDTWALRGNAEQRLGLHADAAQSHLIALRIRPTEGKWMIGAAISLAALGKLDEAQMWAERARERDAVTPAIAAYLQQLGITTRR